MPKISIVDRGAKDYQAWLQPESPDHLTPRALSSELVLVHEWQPGHHNWEHRISRTHSSFTSTGAGYTTPTAVVNSPDPGWIRYVLGVSGVMGSAGMALIIMHTGAASVANGVVLAASRISQACVFLERPVIVSSNRTISIQWQATAAGESSEFESVWADFRCCEPLPRL